MAVREAVKSAADAAPASLRGLRRRRSHGRAMLTLLTLLGAIVAALPTMTVLTVALVPTLTWFIVDMTPGRYACRCIAGFNLAGLTPYLYKLWTGRNDMSAAVAIISDPFALFVFYGAAALGFLLFLGLPGIVAMIRTLNAERQVRLLRDEQRELVQEWGRGITGNAASGEAGDGPEEDPAEASRAQPAASGAE